MIIQKNLTIMWGFSVLVVFIVNNNMINNGWRENFYMTMVDSDINQYKYFSNVNNLIQTEDIFTSNRGSFVSNTFIFINNIGLTNLNSTIFINETNKVSLITKPGIIIKYELFIRKLNGDEISIGFSNEIDLNWSEYSTSNFMFDLKDVNCSETDRLGIRRIVTNNSDNVIDVSLLIGGDKSGYINTVSYINHGNLSFINGNLLYQHIDTVSTEFEEPIDETNDKFTIWDNSLLKWIRFSFTSLKTWLSSLFLKLDQTTPQTITQSPKINDLVAGQMCYVDANKQLKPIDVFWDNVNRLMGVGRSTPKSLIHISLETPSTNGVLRPLIVETQTTGTPVVGIGVGIDFRSEHTSSGLIESIATIDAIVTNNFRSGALSFRVSQGSTPLEAMRINYIGNVGIKTTTPKSALQVAGGIQCGDDTAAASADKVGTIRQRDVNNNTLLEFCKNVAGVYEWEKINDKLSLDQTTPQTITQSPKINDLVAGQMCYVDANKQLKPIDVFWDNVNKRMGINISPLDSFVVKTIGQGLIRFGGANGRTLSAYTSSNVKSSIDIDGGIATNNILFVNTIYGFNDYNSRIQLFSPYLALLAGGSEQVRVLASTGFVGFGLTNPKSRVHSAGGIQCGDDTAAASADKVGTTRYRATANASYVEMCMQVGASSYSWITIVTNTW